MATYETLIEPFLKWAGGKRWFVANHSNLLPNKFNRYIEPFLGSGAVFFYLCPQKAVLGDSNPELIETYKAIKDNWRLVFKYLKTHHLKHSKKYYYKIRGTKPRSPASRAARLIYLNRTCWNGLYRVNKKGDFNVPIGTRSSVVRSNDSFEKISERLNSADLCVCDFEELVNIAREGDFLCVDPPYTVRHNNNSFIKYNEKLFSWNDQVRLSKALNRARNRGAIILCTNAYNDCVIDLYKERFYMHSVSRNSNISSKIDTRNKFEELVITTEGDNGRSD